MRLIHYSLLLAFMISGLSTYAQQNVAVTVQSNSFSPKDITIAVGDMVTWTNIGGTHNVNGTQTAYPDNPESFGSGSAANAPWAYSFVFNTPGVYDYHCDPHMSLGMTGTVTVQGPVSTDLLLTGVFDGPLAPGALPKGIELYVLNDIADMSEYGIGSANNGGGSDGVEYTFPAVSATAGSYLYLATESASFEAFFGFQPDFVDDGTSSSVSINGDDAIELFHNGTVVDVFGEINVDGSGQPWEYMDGWAYRLDGTGPDGSTFVLSNWMFSGIDVYDPVLVNADANPPMPVGTYDPNATVQLAANNDQATSYNGEAVTINVLANDVTPNPVTSLMIASNPSNGAAVVMMGNTIQYTPNAGFCGSDSFSYEVCDANDCQTASVTVDVICFPAYSIGAVTTVNNEGSVDSLGVSCELQGVVYGVNLRPGGLQFTIIDGNNDGIAVFSGTEDYGYTVQEGDEVAIWGAIEQFNGLTQINADSVWLVSSGNALVTPTVVTALDESTESQLVKIENLKLVDPAQWTGTGPGFNVDVTDEVNTYQMRIDNDVDLYSMPAPSGTFNLTGIGGQFDNASPYLEGYQLLPRYMEDIDLMSGTVDQRLGAAISFFPNPTRSQLTVQSQEVLDVIRVSTLTGQSVLEVQRPESTETIDLSKLENGAYLITFVKGNSIWVEQFFKF